MSQPYSGLFLSRKGLQVEDDRKIMNFLKTSVDNVYKLVELCSVDISIYI